MYVCGLPVETSCKCHFWRVFTQLRKEKKPEQPASIHRIFLFNRWNRRSFVAPLKVFLLFEENDQSTHLYNAWDTVCLSLLIKKSNFYEKISYRNSNPLSINQLQAILDNDRIRQHLVQVGYVSALWVCNKKFIF
jgi:hypothetical protein